MISFIGMPTMLFMAAASDLFDSQVDKLVLTHTVGPKASAMFQIGVSMVQFVRGVALIPLAVMLAGTAELYRSNPSRLRRLEMLSGSSVQAIGATCAGGLMLFAGHFVTIWLGPGYSEAALSAQCACSGLAAQHLVGTVDLLRHWTWPLSLRAHWRQYDSYRQCCSYRAPHHTHRPRWSPDRLGRWEYRRHADRKVALVALGAA